MGTAVKGPEIDRSALIIVDMQNDFLHREGSFRHQAREHPESNIDMPFLTGTISRLRGSQMPSLGGLAVFGISGFVIGPVIAAFFLVVWEMFAQEYAERPPRINS